jgi:hypothetical protein
MNFGSTEEVSDEVLSITENEKLQAISRYLSLKLKK